MQHKYTELRSTGTIQRRTNQGKNYRGTFLRQSEPTRQNSAIFEYFQNKPKNVQEVLARSLPRRDS